MSDDTHAIAHPKKAAFLAAFAECGNVSEAAKAAGCSRRSHYVWLEEDEYVAAFEDAKAEALDSLQAEARKRALKGSDTLLIFLLKSLDRETFGERTIVEGGDKPIPVYLFAPGTGAK